jgi:hypothetical protein
MLRTTLMPPLSVLLLASGLLAQSERHFSFHYAFTVKGLPPGDKVQVWIPAAHSDPFQEVKVISAKGDLPLKKTHESVYGDEMYYASSSKGKAPDLQFEIVYEVVRREHLTLGIYAPHLEALTLSPKENKQYLSPDALVPVTGLPAEIAVKTTQGETTPLGKAQAIYDYVLANMQYDRTGTGWGRGDALYACAAKKGDCTDFHSLFIAMARSQGIPARFEIGFSLPVESHSGEIAGYDCWAEFFEPKHGWIPVDISEASKHPEQKNYFLGALDANRVQFSIGRDLELNPRQAGPALNYFIYPYVEVQGKAYSNVSLAFSFSDLGVAP